MSDTDRHVVVIGAGVGGLAAALALSRSGNRVTLLERDNTPMPDDVESAFEWDRRGAPQVRHPHVFLARLHHVLRDRFPDVLTSLLAAGVEPRSMLEVVGAAAAPGDDELTVLPCRRATYEWVLRRSVLAHPLVELRVGVGVAGVLAEPSGDGRPRVTGVRLEDGTEVLADVVVASTGRRSDVASWLSPLGIEVVETESDTGIVYLSRFYRLLGDATVPPFAGGRRAGMGFGVIAADRGVYSTTLTVDPDDRELRAHLKDPARYDATLRLLPELSMLPAPEDVEPITPVHTMAGLINRLRRFTSDDGAPLVLGLHAVGDAHTCTNPLYGRGCSLAMVQATLLADAITAHPHDLDARSRAYEEASVAEIEPWYHLSVMTDAAMRGVRNADDLPAGLAGLFGGTITGSDAPTPGRTTVDPVLVRTILRVANLLVTPAQAFSDPDVLTAVLATTQPERTGTAAASERATAITRDDILAVVA